MSIGFAPLDDSGESHVVARKVQKRKTPQMFINEYTECNYVVLFFIVGVMLLALSDLKK